MKKVLSVVLALVMTCSLCACGGAKTTAAKSGNDVPDSMTSSDGKYQIALVTDVGQLKDGSFNEGTWNGVKLYASQNGKSYKYYQPANGSEATDDDRYNAMAAAADAGAEIIVAPGFLQATALEKAATNYPDVKFVFIDGWSLGLDNVAAVAYKEHECGYFAGYAVVKDGYTKLGFCGGGGGTNPACCRYGYGFVQGANDAAKELGVNVDVNYTWLYGSSYSPVASFFADLLTVDVPSKLYVVIVLISPLYVSLNPLILPDFAEPECTVEKLPDCACVFSSYS